MTNLSTHFPQQQAQTSIANNDNRPKHRNVQIRGVKIKSQKPQQPATESAVKDRPAKSVASNQERGRISARDLHKYTIGLLGIFMLFTIGYSSAIYRVDRATKFARATTAPPYSTTSPN